jgi:hypothetical protein
VKFERKKIFTEVPTGVVLKFYCNVKGGRHPSVNARLILNLGLINLAVLFYGAHHYCMECMVVFFLAVCDVWCKEEGGWY